MFDLLGGLLDSWSLWSKVARSEDAGFVWRKRCLELTFDTGSYRAYEDIIEEAARDVGLPRERANELIRQWGELAPWQEAPRVVRVLAEKVPVAVATNSSLALAKVAVGSLGVRIPTVVTVEEAGYYKPHPRPYRMALERLGCEAGDVLFVAGSPGDVDGASRVGLPVYWHNRMHLTAPIPSRATRTFGVPADTGNGRGGPQPDRTLPETGYPWNRPRNVQRKKTVTGFLPLGDP
jgi:2-haloalkanoic acid dehalogenase type II